MRSAPRLSCGGDAAAALSGITTIGAEDDDNGLTEMIKDALREPQLDAAALALTAAGDEEAAAASVGLGEGDAIVPAQPASTPMQSLAECALESESDVIRETAQLVLGNLSVDVTTAANEKHFNAVTQVSASGLLAPLALLGGCVAGSVAVSC